MSEEPKYAEVRKHLRQRVAHMAPGDRIPTEPKLCEEYAVSRATVRHAVADLVSEGLLIRRQGQGTFVTDSSWVEEVQETFANQVVGFHRQQTALGREVTSRVLVNRVTRNPLAAQALGLNAADEVIELERLRYVNQVLYQHVVTYLEASRYPAVLSVDLTRRSLLEFLENQYGVAFARNDLLVRLTQADQNLAELGFGPEGTTVLNVDSTVFTGDDLPVAFSTTIHAPAYAQLSFCMRYGQSLMRIAEV